MLRRPPAIDAACGLRGSTAGTGGDYEEPIFPIAEYDDLRVGEIVPLLPVMIFPGSGANKWKSVTADRIRSSAVRLYRQWDDAEKRGDMLADCLSALASREQTTQ